MGKMTVANAFREFIKALTGESPAGKTVAQVIQDGASKVSAKNEEVPKSIILASSTADSTKKFEIKVIDAGTISATEVVEPDPEPDDGDEGESQNDPQGEGENQNDPQGE